MAKLPDSQERVVDQHGETLDEYPRPSVAVDTAVLAAGDGGQGLEVVLHRRSGGSHADERALPGTFLHEEETLADAVRRSLADKVGLHDVSPRQLTVFDDPRRDERGWVLSVAHVALVGRADVVALLADPSRGVTTEPVDEVRGLPWDHDDIVRRAVAHVREHYALQADPMGLLADVFTLRDLFDVHLSVAAEPGPGERHLSFDTFRRYMLSNGLVVRTGDKRRGDDGHRLVGKPADLYRRAVDGLEPARVVGVRPVRRERRSGSAD